MYCARCGAQRDMDAAFCSRCGAPSGSAAERPSVAGRRSRDLPLLLVGVAFVVLAVVSGAGTAMVLVGHRTPAQQASVQSAPLTASPRPSAARPTPSRLRTRRPQPPPRPPRTPAATPSPLPGPPAVTATASPSARTFAELYREVSHGVVRLETTACGGGEVGSGFLVGPHLVATVAHVVDGAVSVAVREGAATTAGEVVGIDRRTDLALVRTSARLTGHVFDLASRRPPVGTAVGAIGYPLGGQRSFTTGAVSGLGRTIDIGHGKMTGLLQTDAGINPGSSGGPLLDVEGDVVGLVDAKETDADDIGYAIPATTARRALASWRSTTRSVVRSTPECAAPAGPEQVDLAVTDDSGSPVGAQIADTLATYANAVNAGDYRTAYDLLSPRNQALVRFRAFRDRTASTFIVSLRLGGVARVPGAPRARRTQVRFTSIQDPRRGSTGQPCSHWRMTYTLVDRGGGWLIDRTQPHRGSPTGC